MELKRRVKNLWDGGWRVMMKPQDLTEVCLDCWHSDYEGGELRCMKLNMPLKEAVKECEYLAS